MYICWWYVSHYTIYVNYAFYLYLPLSHTYIYIYLYSDRYKARLEHDTKTKQMMVDIQPEPNELSNTLMFKEK